MNRIFRFLPAALLLCGTVLPVQAANYICQVDGASVFTNKKIGTNCQPSHMDGSTDSRPEQVENVPAVAPDLKQKPGELAESGGDISVLPQNPSSLTHSGKAGAANPKLDIRLRNDAGKSARAKAAEMNRRAKIIPAPALPAPPSKPKVQLTRAQILQNEVKNEQTALVRAKAQLNVARAKGDKAKVARLEQTVRDREANIRAIKGEMKR